MSGGIMNIIREYDKKLVEIIMQDVCLDYYSKIEEKKFLGFKLKNHNYFHFFFSLYKDDALLFTFRKNIEEKDVERIYINYENIDVVQKIINNLLLKNDFSDDIYKDYLYILPENIQLKSTEEALNCHFKIDGFTPIEDVGGKSLDKVNISLRLKNALYRYDILTVNQLINTPNDVLLKMNYIGRKSLKEAIKIKNEILGISTMPIFDEEEYPNEINPLFLETDENCYSNKKIIKLNEEYLLFAKNVIEILNAILNVCITNDRNRECFILYFNINEKETYTLEDIGNKFSLSRERVRQIINRDFRKLRRYKKKLIIEFDKIIGEDEYNYLIDGIVSYRSIKCLEAILKIILNEKDFISFKSKIGKCLKPNIIEKSEKTTFEETKNKSREKYENAWCQWNLEEEQQLIEEFILGYNLNNIAKIHKRTKGAIRKRLIKLNLIKE